LKSKGSVSTVYQNNYFEVDPAWVTGLGESLSTAWVTLYEHNYANLIIDSNVFNVYELRLPNTSSYLGNVRISNNLFDTQYLSGYFAHYDASKTTYDHSAQEIIIRDNTIIISAGIGAGTTRLRFVTNEAPGTNKYDIVSVTGNTIKAICGTGIFSGLYQVYANTVIFKNNSIELTDRSQVPIMTGIPSIRELFIENNITNARGATPSGTAVLAQYIPLDAERVVIKNNTVSAYYKGIFYTKFSMVDPSIACNRKIRFKLIMKDNTATRGVEHEFTIRYDVGDTRNYLEFTDNGSNPISLKINKGGADTEPIATTTTDMLVTLPHELWIGEELTNAKWVSTAGSGIPDLQLYDTATFTSSNTIYNFSVDY
jgi:hypothetical protein